MADNVKWIKIMVGLFDGTSFKRIKKAKIGGESFRDKLTAVWFELLDLGAKCNNGGFLYSDEIPYGSEEDIAIMIDREVDEIKLCLEFYKQNGMIEIIDDLYCLSNWSKYQNTDGLDRIREQNRIRQRRYRAGKLVLNDDSICQYCGAKATGVDHILATSKGGSNEEKNKVECCIDCNRIKNDKPLVDFLNYNRERIRDDIVLANEKLNKLVKLEQINGELRYVVTGVTLHRNENALISNSNSINNINNNDLDNNISINNKKKNFVKPTLEDVKAYCDERKNGIDPEYFIAFYESNGWKVGKNPMKNWKMAMTTWEKRNKQNEQPKEIIKSKYQSNGFDSL